MKSRRIISLFVATSFALALTILLAGSVLAAGSGIFIDSGQRLGNFSSYDVSLGDVDGDNDLDAFVVYGTEDSGHKVWLNNGNGVFTDSGQSLGSSHGASVFLGDVDGDDDLDAFVVSFGYDYNKVWLNNGNGVFTDSGQSLGNSWAIAISMGDVDGDDDLDAFIGNCGEPDEVWLNDGNGIFTDSGQSLGNSPDHGVALGDVDGDNDPDAFVANYGGYSDRIWLNVEPLSNCSPAFIDEFCTLDVDRWIPSDWLGGGENIPTRFYPHNVIPVPAECKLQLKVPSNVYQGGEVVTKECVSYGRYRVRMKASSVDNTIQAFFVYARPYTLDMGHREIDIEFGLWPESRSKITFTIYIDKQRIDREVILLDFDPSEGYYEYGFDWYEDRVDFYVGPFRRWTSYTDVSPDPLGQPLKLILNNWVKDWPEENPPPLPQEDSYMLVDQVSYTPLLDEISFCALSPVDISVVDPDDLLIDIHTNEITGATYTETDVNGDGDLDDVVTIPQPRFGDYKIVIIPETNTNTSETYTLQVLTGNTTIVLAEDIPINNIPSQGYIARLTEMGIEQIIPETLPGCFIATATYGTPMVEEIQILRDFRDEYLLANPLGQGFVDFYYQVSPPIAEFINEHPSLKPIVRTGLLPVVVMSTVIVNTTVTEKIVIVSLLVLVSVVVAIWVTRRRGRPPEYI